MAIRVSHKSPKVLQVAQTHSEFGSWGCSCEDNTMPTQWPITRIVEAHHGQESESSSYVPRMERIDGTTSTLSVADLRGGKGGANEPLLKLIIVPLAIMEPKV